MVPNTRTSWFPRIAGADIRSVQAVFKGEDSQLFTVHHQRGAEPYTCTPRRHANGRGRLQPKHIFLRKKHAHHKDIQQPRTDKRVHIRTVRSVHTLRTLTFEPVREAHIDVDHRNRPIHGNNAYARPAGPHRSPTLTPIGHIRQALRNQLRLVRSILPVLGIMLSLLVHGIPITNTHYEH